MSNKKIWDLPRTNTITGNEVVLLTTQSDNPTADLNKISAWFSGKTTAYNFGALDYEPVVSPFDGGPIPLGAQYYNTVNNELRAYGTFGWFTPNIDAQLLAQPTGGTMVGTPEGTVQVALDNRWAKVDLAASGGAEKIGTTGGRTVQDHLAESINVCDHGATNDGVDSTAAISALFSTLPADWAGVIYIPPNVSFRFNDVEGLLPVRASVKDDSGINAWNTVGFRQKVVGWWERGDPTSVTDLNPMVSSGHHATAILENRGTAGSSSALARIVSMLWSVGRFLRGEPGVRSMARLVFSVSPNDSSIWSLQVRKMAPFVAKNYERWSSGWAVQSGVDYCYTSAGFYVAASTGTTGGVTPTHTSGTASDGVVDWTFLENQVDASLLTIDERGRIATNGAQSGSMVRFKQNVLDAASAAFVWFQSTGTSKNMDVRIQGTDGSGTQLTNTPYLRATSAGNLTVLAPSTSKTLVDFDPNIARLRCFGTNEVTASNGDTTPSVANAGALGFVNTSATSVTTLDDGQTGQEVELVSYNTNTTLVHGSGLVLKGAVDAALPALGVIVVKRFAQTSAWVEMSRNF